MYLITLYKHFIFPYTTCYFCFVHNSVLNPNKMSNLKIIDSRKRFYNYSLPYLVPTDLVINK